MQVGAVSVYNFNSAKPKQQVGFKGFGGGKVIAEEELMQQTFEVAIRYGINIVGKDFRTVARELIETQGLLKQAIREYGFTPLSQELSELRREVAAAKKLFSEAQSCGINTAGKSIYDIQYEVNAARTNPSRQDGAKSGYGTNSQRATSMRELVEKGPKTKADAILVFNALGMQYKISTAERITQLSAKDEIKRAFRGLLPKLHPDAGGNEDHMRLLNQANDLLSK